MRKLISRKEKEGKNIAFRIEYSNGDIKVGGLLTIINNITKGRVKYYTIGDTLVTIEGKGNDRYLTTSPNDGGLDNINNLPTYD